MATETIRWPPDVGVRILGIPGSLRSASYNRALLRTAQELAPQGAEVETFELHEVPPYDGDLEAEGDPAAVAALKESIKESDALLIASPEYNRGTPGVLKNAIDWASRPPFASPLSGKAVALMAASTGRFGGRRALDDARRVLTHTRSDVLPDRDLSVARAADRFDLHGRLVDERMREDISSLLADLITFVQRSRAISDAVAAGVGDGAARRREGLPSSIPPAAGPDPRDGAVPVRDPGTPRDGAVRRDPARLSVERTSWPTNARLLRHLRDDAGRRERLASQRRTEHGGCSPSAPSPGRWV